MAFLKSEKNVLPSQGIEPRTFRLWGWCSSTELILPNFKGTKNFWIWRKYEIYPLICMKKLWMQFPKVHRWNISIFTKMVSVQLVFIAESWISLAHFNLSYHSSVGSTVNYALVSHSTQGLNNAEVESFQTFW